MMIPLKKFNFCSSSRKTKNLTTGIHGVSRGLNFEDDTEIGQKGAFLNGIVRLCIYALLIFTPLAVGSSPTWAMMIIHLITLIALTAYLIEKIVSWEWRWIKTSIDIPWPSY